MDCGSATLISECGFWRGAARKFYAFTKQLIGWAPWTYAYIQISEVEMPFTSK